MTIREDSSNGGITILGLGISPTEHLTLRRSALSASRVVLYVDHSVATEPLLARYCPRWCR